jgi:hypothetical protein
MSRRAALAVAGFGTLAAAALIIAGFFAAAAVLQGWLVALVFWSSLPIGALVLLLIHRLTGGRWGEAAMPVLAPTATTLPLFAPLFVPVLAALAAIYPWAADPQAIKPDVVAAYLNLPGYVLRTLLAFVGWTIFLLAVVRLGAGRLMAALGLLFHGVLISAIAVDWAMSTDPHFHSTAFAALFASQQLLAALAWTALFAPAIADEQARADLAGLMIATLVGVFYLALMTLIVAWYGDLPHPAAWFHARVRGGWQWVIALTFIFESAAPFLMLLPATHRRAPRWLQAAGGSVLIGAMLHVAWWMGADFRSGAMAAAAAATVVVGAAFVLGWRRFTPASAAEVRHG